MAYREESDTYNSPSFQRLSKSDQEELNAVFLAPTSSKAARQRMLNRISANTQRQDSVSSATARERMIQRINHRAA